MAESTSCCPNPGIDASVDFSSELGSAQGFLERHRFIPVNQNPGARFTPQDSRWHDIPLESPLPLPELQQFLNGEPQPDRGKTLDWPNPDLEAEANGS